MVSGIVAHVLLGVFFEQFLRPADHGVDPSREFRRVVFDDFLRRDMRRTQYNLRFTSGTTGSALRIFDGVD